MINFFFFFLFSFHDWFILISFVWYVVWIS